MVRTKHSFSRAFVRQKESAMWGDHHSLNSLACEMRFDWATVLVFWGCHNKAPD